MLQEGRPLQEKMPRMCSIGSMFQPRAHSQPLDSISMEALGFARSVNNEGPLILTEKERAELACLTETWLTQKRGTLGLGFGTNQDPKAREWRGAVDVQESLLAFRGLASQVFGCETVSEDELMGSVGIAASALASLLHSNLPVWAAGGHLRVVVGVPKTYGPGRLEPTIPVLGLVSSPEVHGHQVGHGLP